MKVLLVVLITVLVSSCSSKFKKPPPGMKLKLVHFYEHPEHGEVALPSPLYQQGVKKCESEIYSQGVVISGVKVTDEKVISKYQGEYIISQARATLKNSALCGNTGLSSLSCKAQEPISPDRYKEAERVANAVKRCVAGLGWKKSKTDYIHVPR